MLNKYYIELDDLEENNKLYCGDNFNKNDKDGKYVFVVDHWDNTTMGFYNLSETQFNKCKKCKYYNKCDLLTPILFRKDFPEKYLDFLIEM